MQQLQRIIDEAWEQRTSITPASAKPSFATP
jgi:hypothetical protein